MRAVAWTGLPLGPAALASGVPLMCAAPVQFVSETSYLTCDLFEAPFPYALLQMAYRDLCLRRRSAKGPAPNDELDT